VSRVQAVPSMRVREEWRPSKPMEATHLRLFWVGRVMRTLSICVGLLSALMIDRAVSSISEGSYLCPDATARPTRFKVALDPGHGGLNYGAANPREEGRNEKEYTLKIAKKVRRYLKSSGVGVWMSRTRDIPVSLRERIRAAGVAGADLFISVHINDADMVGPRGHGTFFLAREVFEESRLRLHQFDKERRGKIFKRSVKARVKAPEIRRVLLDLIHQRAQHESAHLAHIVNQTLSEFSPHGTRGVKQADFGVIKGLSTPAIVCEVGFINHPIEGPYVTSEYGMTELSKAIALGILRYLTLRRDAELKIPASLAPSDKAPKEATKE
jgi:N-acetylmuramoyl-L-alanine amidase